MKPDAAGGVESVAESVAVGPTETLRTVSTTASTTDLTAGQASRPNSIISSENQQASPSSNRTVAAIPASSGPTGPAAGSSTYSRPVLDMGHVMLQYRDLRPEDFELLLKLDEGIPRRGTLPANFSAALPRCSAGTCGAKECGVCLQPLEPETTVSRLPCEHSFHPECISRWLTDFRSTCPLCTTQVVPPDAQETRPGAHTA